MARRPPTKAPTAFASPKSSPPCRSSASLRVTAPKVRKAGNTATAPAAKKPTDHGWELAWTYENLLSGFPVISYFAPVSLFFFFFVLLMIFAPDELLSPGGSFFAFHWLSAYLADHLNVHATFLVCSLVSVFLLISYLRLVVNLRFAAVEAGLASPSPSAPS